MGDRRCRRVHESDLSRHRRRSTGMFFMVWCPETWAPAMTYADAWEAHDEAKRLKQCYPERDFYVLTPMARFEYPVFYTVGPDGGLKPFDEE